MKVSAPFNKDKVWCGTVSFIERVAFEVLAANLEDAIKVVELDAIYTHFVEDYEGTAESLPKTLVSAHPSNNSTNDERNVYSVAYDVVCVFMLPIGFTAPNVEVALAKAKSRYAKDKKTGHENSFIVDIRICEVQRDKKSPVVV